MTSHLFALGFYAKDPVAQARFWAGVLGWKLADEAADGAASGAGGAVGTGGTDGADGVAGGVAILPNDDTGFRIRFYESQEPTRGPNQAHFDLTSQSPEEQQATVARALELGARHLDIGQGDDAKHVVLADPEGNEFCVLPAGNKFLAECGFLGALSSDGTQALGYFWSKALDWPLVWDQDEETAIRSPQGGPKITWGGPPVAPKLGTNRLFLELVPPADGDQQAEVDRLVALGARVEGEPGEDGRVLMFDVDGNEFAVLPPR
ncbi:VOC family protein [Kribbella deserti]|uniref:VOC family protein n=1 Tax=Kribbella deserti TaxID=1926257 RepID=A0ABV6QXT5_9ACTN